MSTVLVQNQSKDFCIMILCLIFIFGKFSLMSFSAKKFLMDDSE